MVKSTETGAGVVLGGESVTVNVAFEAEVGESGSVACDPAIVSDSRARASTSSQSRDDPAHAGTSAGLAASRRHSAIVASGFPSSFTRPETRKLERAATGRKARPIAVILDPPPGEAVRRAVPTNRPHRARLRVTE